MDAAGAYACMKCRDRCSIKKADAKPSNIINISLSLHPSIQFKSLVMSKKVC